MSELTRRDLGLAMAAFAALASVAEAQAGVQSGADLSKSTVFRYDALPVVRNANGGEGRSVVRGTLPTGEYVELHETMLPPGQMPHPPHKHSHSEFILIREGTLQHLNDGKAEASAGPGDIIFNASMVMHGLKNVGTVPARYFVVAVGVQTTA